jgi:hypothetical protein
MLGVVNMPRQLLERVRKHDPFVIEMCGGLGILGWGVAVSISGSDNLLTYSMLTKYHVPLLMWCYWAMISGAAQLIFTLRDYRPGRLACAWSQVLLFNTLGVVILKGPDPGPGYCLYFSFGLGALWSVLHLTQRGN